MDQTRPSDETRRAERDEARMPGVADRPPTSEEEERAEQLPGDPEAAEHYAEMAERGANQKGEGRIP